MLIAIALAAGLLLTRIAHAAVGAVDPAPSGIDWTFWIAVGSAILGGISLVLHVVAPRTKNTIDDEIRDDVDKLLAFMRVQQPQNTKPAPRDPQAGSSFLGMLAALTFCGVVAAVIACTATQARQTAAAGVVATLDCEDAHIDAQALADARSFADAKILQWLAGALAPAAAKIKADLAPIKSDLGRCAIAGALAAATALVSPTPGVATSALTAGPDPALVRGAFATAARQLGWLPVKIAGGEVL